MRPVPAALRHRDFAIFWSGLVISAVGSQFSSVAMAWQIYELTNSPFQIGLLGLARALPQMALVLFGGLLADAIDRRRLLMITQVAQFLVTAGLVALTAAELISPITLYVASALLAVATALETPARQALVPNLVPREDLTSALALSSTQRNAAAILGPSLAGLVLAVSGPFWCYAVNAASYLASVGAISLVRGRPQAAGGRRVMSLGALRSGMEFVWANPVMLALMVLDFGATFFGNPRALFPIYARDILDVGAQGLGILYAANSIGSLAAAALMSAVPQWRRAGVWVLVGVAFYGACTVVFALSTTFWLSVLMLAGTGAGNTLSAILRGTINQLLTPDELRGRVTSVNSFFTQGGPQLGQFESGLVAGLWSAELSALTGGLATLLVVLGVAAVPGVRQFRMGPDRVRRRNPRRRAEED